jgi:hypothetical protein
VNGLLNRLGQLEARFERLIFGDQQLAQRVAAIEQRLRDLQQPSGGGSGGTGAIYFVEAADHTTSIAAKSSLAGVNVSAIISGSVVSQGPKTIFNRLNDATVTGHELVLGPNPDGSGTMLLIDQGCTAG